MGSMGFSRLLVAAFAAAIALGTASPAEAATLAPYRGFGTWVDIYDGAVYAAPTAAWPPGRARTAPVGFDSITGAFSDEDGPVDRPEWIVVAESPLRLYTAVAPELRTILGREYERVQAFTPTREPEPESWFDRQDAFFLPYANFSRRDRPGPQITIYRRIAR